MDLTNPVARLRDDVYYDTQKMTNEMGTFHDSNTLDLIRNNYTFVQIGKGSKDLTCSDPIDSTKIIISAL